MGGTRGCSKGLVRFRAPAGKECGGVGAAQSIVGWRMEQGEGAIGRCVRGIYSGWQGVAWHLENVIVGVRRRAAGEKRTQGRGRGGCRAEKGGGPGPGSEGGGISRESGAAAAAAWRRAAASRTAAASECGRGWRAGRAQTGKQQ